ncbi:EGF-like domain 7, isoform CRA_f [Rattus norvegicus]|uniref:EGF-like domain 7, isoform CRA_f n=1 Tax=Rattus norvegicus TaxID=10116 RepID=A6JTG0_RAT|nr:EGF-like domain 7, isoform CRA_f [Rattus norvegicus]
MHPCCRATLPWMPQGSGNSPEWVTDRPLLPTAICHLLAHSFQQLDRIDSLSEQVSFLEEQLGSCSCKKDL